MRTPIRLTKFWQQLIFVAASVVVSWLLGTIHTSLHLPTGSGFNLLFGIVGQVLLLGEVWVGTRVFRRADSEHVEPSRALWRATARPIAGYLIGVYMIVSTIAYVVTGNSRGSEFDGLSVVVSAVIAVFYLNSSIRLSRKPMLWTNPSVRGPYEATGGWPAKAVAEE